MIAIEILTRIANINEDLWSELFIGNKDNLIESIDNFINEINYIKSALVESDDKRLKELFSKVK